LLFQNWYIGWVVETQHKIYLDIEFTAIISYVYNNIDLSNWMNAEEFKSMDPNWNFGCSPRKCIANRLAEFEAVALLSKLLHRYQMTCPDNHPSVKLIGVGILHPKVPIHVKFSELNGAIGKCWRVEWILCGCHLKCISESDVIWISFPQLDWREINFELWKLISISYTTGARMLSYKIDPREPESGSLELKMHNDYIKLSILFFFFWSPCLSQAWTPSS